MTKGSSPSRPKPSTKKHPASPVRASRTTSSTSGENPKTVYQRNYRMRRLVDPRIKARLLLKVLTDEEIIELLEWITTLHPEIGGQQ